MRGLVLDWDEKGESMSKEVIVVRGNGILTGEVHASGAKNSALKLMAASLLGQEIGRASGRERV